MDKEVYKTYIEDRIKLLEYKLHTIESIQDLKIDEGTEHWLSDKWHTCFDELQSLKIDLEHKFKT